MECVQRICCRCRKRFSHHGHSGHRHADHSYADLLLGHWHHDYFNKHFSNHDDLALYSPFDASLNHYRLASSNNKLDVCSKCCSADDNHDWTADNAHIQRDRYRKQLDWHKVQPRQRRVWCSKSSDEQPDCCDCHNLRDPNVSNLDTQHLWRHRSQLSDHRNSYWRLKLSARRLTGWRSFYQLEWHCFNHQLNWRSPIIYRKRPTSLISDQTSLYSSQWYFWFKLGFDKLPGYDYVIDQLDLSHAEQHGVCPSGQPSGDSDFCRRLWSSGRQHQYFERDP